MPAKTSAETSPYAKAQAEFGAHDERILVLQGGGALGAYQAGVYEGLAKAGFAPNWVAGTSIGAINAALIVGNAPELRLERLKAFWDLVSSRASGISAFAGMDLMRPWLNRMSAASAAAFGISGFYVPRVPPPAFAPEGSIGALSYYDTEPLRATLDELVDFDLINRGDVRLSLGAVNACTGEAVYFDNTTHTITASHVMASGALPPAFPPLEIDGEWYWDGGIMSNTPLLHVAENPQINALIVQVDLFSGTGDLPRNMDQVAERAKDIQYQSKQRHSTDKIRKIEELRSALAEVLMLLPEDKRADPKVKMLEAVSHRGPLSLVHLVNRHDTQSNNFKDYEFSRATVTDLWHGGRDDIRHVMTDPMECRVTDLGNGVRAFNL